MCAVIAPSSHPDSSTEEVKAITEYESKISLGTKIHFVIKVTSYANLTLYREE